MTWRSWLVWSAIGAVLALLYLPLVPPFFFSLLPETPAEPAPTLRWYVEMWRNPVLTGAVVTSMEAAVIVALATPLFALVAAISIRELKMPRLILGLMLLPLLVPGVSMGIAVAFFFKQIGIAPSLGTIVIVQILRALPFALLVVLTAMSTFDPVLTEAAHMSGAGRWRAFRDIELPLIWPGVSGAAPSRSSSRSMRQFEPRSCKARSTRCRPTSGRPTSRSGYRQRFMR